MQSGTGDGEVRRTFRGESVPAAWRSVTRGVRCRHTEDEDPFPVNLHGWQEVLPPDARWTHLTAARIRGWWLPPTPPGLPLFAAHSAHHRVRREGLVTTRRSSVGEFDLIDGIRVDPPVEIIASCARDLSELDLCCLVATALAAGSCTTGDLDAVAEQPRRGMRTLRQVLTRADHRYESIWEVLLAELHRSCDVAVVPQHVVRTGAGDFVARGDLWLVGTTRLHEYDGDHHATRRQRTSDLRREGRLSRAGWSRRGYAKDDVLHQAVQVLADADHALGRPHDPTRIRGWHALLRPSLFTPTGRTTLQQRLSLEE